MRFSTGKGTVVDSYLSVFDLALENDHKPSVTSDGVEIWSARMSGSEEEADGYASLFDLAMLAAPVMDPDWQRQYIDVPLCEILVNPERRLILSIKVDELDLIACPDEATFQAEYARLQGIIQAFRRAVAGGECTCAKCTALEEATTELDSGLVAIDLTEMTAEQRAAVLAETPLTHGWDPSEFN